MYGCALDEDIDDRVEEQVKRIVGYLISVLQLQVAALNNPDRRQRVRRRRS